MFRILLVLALLGGGTYALIAFVVPKKPTPKGEGDPEGQRSGATSERRKLQGVVSDSTTYPDADRQHKGIKDLVIPNCRVATVHDLEISSRRAGEIVVLGKKVTPEEAKKLGRHELQKITVGYIEVEVGPEGNRTIKRWLPTDRIDLLKPGLVHLRTETYYFRKMRIDDEVEKDELIGVIRPDVVLAEVSIRVQELLVAENERLAADKTMREAYRTYQAIVTAPPGTFSTEEIERSKLVYERSGFELKSKENQIKASQAQIKQVTATMYLHEIRAGIDGRVSDILKKAGETVREHEPVLRLEHHKLVYVEGQISSEDRQLAREKMSAAEARAKEENKGSGLVRVRVEFARPKKPVLELVGHSRAINAVAVSKGKSPVIASVSDDGKLMIGQLVHRRDILGNPRGWEYRWLASVYHHSGSKGRAAVKGYSAVKTVVCSPANPKSQENLCFTGTEDGKGRLWNLDEFLARKKAPKAYLLPVPHDGAILCAAFNSDGTLLATGGADRWVHVWTTKRTSKGETTWELLHRIDKAHQGAVTSVQFTPTGQLVTAGQDDDLHLWSVSKSTDKRPTVLQSFPNRGGQVAQLALAPSGKEVLFDQGNELRFQTLEDNTTVSVLSNPATGITFSTFALFSPDGQTLLTASTADDYLQLWRNPVTAKEVRRPSELRRLIWKTGAATCAAFAPEVPLLVTGTKDRKVLVWDVPSKEEVEENSKNADLILLGRSVDSSDKARIRARLDARPEDLLVGMTATIVIDP